MDLRKLRYFVGVAESGGFRRAADTMAIAQPSLSKHIRELERELNTRLFERSHVGIHLTPHGHKLLAESQAILERIDNLRRTVTEEDDVLRGSVRIVALRHHAGGNAAHARRFEPARLRRVGDHADDLGRIIVACRRRHQRLHVRAAARDQDGDAFSFAHRSIVPR